MRIQTLVFACAVAAASTIATQAQDETKKPAAAEPVAAEPAPAPPVAKPAMSLKQQASYGIGMSLGRNLQRQGISLDVVDVNVIAQGILDSLSDKDSIVSQTELQAAFSDLQKAIDAKKAAAAAKNAEDGRKFLVANAKKKGVTTTKSGLQYEVIKSGNGPTPTKSDTVTTHYKGQLINGDIFDGSYRGKEPTLADETVSFPVGGVIKGWTEALLMMKVGDKWRLFIPSELAYGEDGAGADIGPDSTLIFEIELIAIK